MIWSSDRIHVIVHIIWKHHCCTTDTLAWSWTVKEANHALLAFRYKNGYACNVNIDVHSLGQAVDTAVSRLGLLMWAILCSYLSYLCGTVSQQVFCFFWKNTCSPWQCWGQRSNLSKGVDHRWMSSLRNSIFYPRAALCRTMNSSPVEALRGKWKRLFSKGI